jgi:hypothetical protein
VFAGGGNTAGWYGLTGDNRHDDGCQVGGMIQMSSAIGDGLRPRSPR